MFCRSILTLFTLGVMAAERGECQALDQAAGQAIGMTATEGANDNLVWEATERAQRDLKPPPPHYDDSVVTHGRTWVTSLQGTAQRGLQIDAMGVIAVRAGDDAAAQQQFAARLATPGLSIGDRAYTAYLAVKTFVRDPANTARLEIARTYVTMLDTIPLTPEAMWYRFTGHRDLAVSYYARRDSAVVVREILAADAVIPSIPFHQRYWPARRAGLLIFAEMVSSQPNAKARVDSLKKFLTAAFTAPPALAAQDSEYVWMSQGYLGWINEDTHQLDLLGKKGAVIVGTYWYGMPAPAADNPVAPGAKNFAVDDGHIRVIEFGERSCAPCMGALPALRRVHAAAPPEVQFLYVTETEGSWGADLVEAPVEVEHLRNLFLTKEKLNMPLAIWAGPKQRGSDNTFVPMGSPNYFTYISATPTLVVTDGHGIVRHVGAPIGDEAEKDLVEKLRRLVLEAGGGKSAPPSGTTSPASIQSH